MKQIIAYIMVFLGLLGCEQKPAAWFEPEDSVYFEYMALHEKPLDSVYFSFGRIDNKIHWDTISVIVKFSGRLVGYDRIYKVRVLEKGVVRKGETTMKEGIDYKPITIEQTMAANSWIDTLKIEVCRDNISSSFVLKQTKTLMLGLEASDDFSLGVKNGRETKIVVDNYLSEPSWWDSKRGYFHAYHPEKYKILMTFQSALTNPDDVSSISNLEFNSLSNYLDDHLKKHVVLDPETGERIFLDHTEPYPGV